MLVSPAEPAPLRALGRTSSIPERYGADFLIFSPHLGRIGIQRKEISDLLHSLQQDDRLSREIPQLQSLDIAILIIEGQLTWTADGYLYNTTSQFTLTQFRGLLWSLQYSGLWISFTNSVTETIEYLLQFTRWTEKPRHTTLLRRNKSKARNVYGTRDSREWQIHVMQGFPGIGYDRAQDIVDFYGGLPLTWTGELIDVPGIGKVTATRLKALLNGA